MSRPNEREIARKLAERESFEPPAGLLEKIKSEIPAEISVGTAVPGTAKGNAMPVRQRWLIAASMILAVGAGAVGFRVWQGEGNRLASQAESQKAAPAAQGRMEEAKPAPILGPSGPPTPPPAAKISQDAGGAPAAEQAPMTPPMETQPEQRKDLESRRDANLQSPLPPLAAPENVPAPPPPPPPAKPAVEASRVEGGVVGGVPGGVVGGVVGGVPGGVPGPVPDEVLQRRRVQNFAAAESPMLDQRVTAAKMAEKKEKDGKAYDAVLFKSAGTNPFVDTTVDRLSTFGLDVDTASYTVARRYIGDGNLPDPDSVRVEEWVNYFDYGDPAPARGEDFAIRAEGAPSPFAHGPQYRLLRFNIKARQIQAGKRRPAVLTFVIDVSGSMNQQNRLGLVKDSLFLLIDQLRPDDRVGLVVFGDTARLLLEPSNNREAIRQAILRLTPEGSTNTEEGLSMGYDVAGRNFRMNASNRIILCSDGVANVGHTGPQAILGRIGREARRGIELTTLGFGMGNYNDHLMEQLADKGDGRYAYLDTLDEAKRVLVDELTGTLQTIAKNAKVQVELNPVVVARYRLLGYENRAIADQRFRDETVDAGEVGAGHSVTALYEIELRADAPHWEQPVATLHLRYKVPEVGNITETVRRVGFEDFAPTWEGASPALRLAGLVAELAEVFKGSPWAKSDDLNDVARRLREVVRQLPGNAKAGELADLAERAARIKAGQGRREE
ncbi:MAG: Ca-activated chloride channel [Acidobacteriota bacterium]|jgi:Ca-activated chloride channel family protein|nr:Ca-activated chloride channel [Acidobacteriota bacterium]